jgi:hypothetical protein
MSVCRALEEPRRPPVANAVCAVGTCGQPCASRVALQRGPLKSRSGRAHPPPGRARRPRVSAAVRPAQRRVALVLRASGRSPHQDLCASGAARTATISGFMRRAGPNAPRAGSSRWCRALGRGGAPEIPDAEFNTVEARRGPVQTRMRTLQKPPDTYE